MTAIFFDNSLGKKFLMLQPINILLVAFHESPTETELLENFQTLYLNHVHNLQNLLLNNRF